MRRRTPPDRILETDVKIPNALSQSTERLIIEQPPGNSRIKLRVLIQGGRDVGHVGRQGPLRKEIPDRIIPSGLIGV